MTSQELKAKILEAVSNAVEDACANREVLNNHFAHVRAISVSMYCNGVDDDGAPSFEASMETKHVSTIED